jgi:hypothetical protein
VYGWGLQFSLRGEKDPPFETTTVRYLIEYELVGAVTPAWDLVAGALPLDDGTIPRNPLDRANEVLAGWRAAWPQLDSNYRFDHDVLFPSRGAPDGVVQLNYRFEYDTAWRLLDKDREIGVATPDVDYRVQRILQYLPKGRPAGADVRKAAFRIGGVMAPLVLGLLLGLLFMVTNRIFGMTPRGDRALFEARIEGLPPELIAARLGQSARAPSFETLILRMAAERKVSVTTEKPETDETDALISMRLTVDRARLSPFERAVVDPLFGPRDTVTTADIQDRHRGEEFDPDDLTARAFEVLAPTPVVTRRPLWAALHLSLMGGGIALLVRALADRTLADPAPLLAGILPGNALARLWPKGSATRPPSLLVILLALASLGVLGAALALIPNTPLGGFAALGLGLLGIGHCAGYLAALPKPSAEDAEFDAAREWARRELGKPRPALKDAWVEALQVLCGRRALAKWRERHAGAFTGAPDMSDLQTGDVPVGPPFTGEGPRPPALPPNWSEGFRVNGDEDGDDDEKNQDDENEDAALV